MTSEEAPEALAGQAAEPVAVSAEAPTSNPPVPDTPAAETPTVETLSGEQPTAETVTVPTAEASEEPEAVTPPEAEPETVPTAEASEEPEAVTPPEPEPAVAEIQGAADEDETVDEGGRGRAGRAVRAPDPVCAAAVDVAREAAVEEAGDADAVGEHLSVEAEGERLVLHRFACRTPAYRGWVWAVITARAPRVRRVTVDDVVLMPGEGALLAPPWVPWSQRLRPGDVGVGDLLPTAVDDPRLALRRSDVDELVDTDDFLELGLGRPRVLSAIGREEASARWYAGEPGPDAHVAKVAPATCLTCGFHVRLAGALGRLFGACANELAPDDARVTSIDHGCGAHSEALVAPSAHPESVPFDEDPSDLTPTDVELVGATAGGAGGDASGISHAGRPEPYGHA
ncbi:DUF3027 domain-containing protein [Pseudofrankia saprophytica]|uniref:DUF3027 domain-containing protein n=1 Tax=Pseudofrankia saprophytica TaxID=298655 RepID=UPI00031B858D|nr:DUF3027 domain-containing protein [Pseudofrankia saprophytica]